MARNHTAEHNPADPNTADNDDYIPLSRVPHLSFLPIRRRGRKLHTSTVYRWSGNGLNGVRLRYAKCGGVRCTKIVWLHEFFTALAEQDAASAPDVIEERSVTPSGHQDEIEKELDRMGVTDDPADATAKGVVESIKRGP